MRRVFTELMPPERLLEATTLAALDRFDLQTLVALPPGAETPAMGRALCALAEAGAGLGIWPLLSDREGYWPCDDNAPAFAARVEATLAFAAAAGAKVQTVVVDLEPPLAVMTELLSGGPAGHARALARRVRAAARPAAVEGRARARRAYAELRGELDARGLETYATVIPPVLLDEPGQRAPWQAIFQTRALDPGWSRVCPMLYTSVFGALLPSGRPSRARAAAAALAGRGVEVCGDRAAAALGLVGVGKLGDEPVLSGPDALAADVAAVRAAGIDDLALFSLEGALDRPDPEAWLLAFTETPAGRPSPLGARAWRWGLGWGRAPGRLARILEEHV